MVFDWKSKFTLKFIDFLTGGGLGRLQISVSRKARKVRKESFRKNPWILCELVPV